MYQISYKEVARIPFTMICTACCVYHIIGVRSMHGNRRLQWIVLISAGGEAVYAVYSIAQH